jgi:membrane protein
MKTAALYATFDPRRRLSITAHEGPKSSVTSLVMVRLVSFGLAFGVAFLFVVSLVLDSAVQAGGKWVFGNSPRVILGDAVQSCPDW